MSCLTDCGPPQEQWPLILTRNEVGGRKVVTPNLAAWSFGVNDLRVLPFDEGANQPKHGEVRLDIGAVGICGSDVHYWEKGSIGKYLRPRDFFLGLHTNQGRTQFSVAYTQGIY